MIASRTRSTAFLALALLALGGIAGVASAVGVSGRLDELDAAMAARRDELASVPDDKLAAKAVKRLDGARRLFAKSKTSVSLANELLAASKVAGTLEKKLGDETALLALVDAAEDGYRAHLRDARSGLSAAAASSAGKRAPNYRKLLAATDKALAASLAATTRAKALAQLAKAAKTTNGFEITGASAAWVVTSLTLAAPNAGVDLDGDGNPDNAVGAARETLEGLGDGIDLDALLAEALMSADGDLILQFWAIDSFDVDDRVFAGALRGIDTHDTAYESQNGYPLFDVSGAVDPADGYPAARGLTAFTGGGAFDASYGGDALPLGDVQLDAANRLVVSGTASADANVGHLGFAIPLTVVRTLLEESGVTITPLVNFGLAALADIDLDGNGSGDAVSVSLAYAATQCGVTAQE